MRMFRLLCVCLLTALAMPAFAAAPHWKIVPEKSSIEWAVDYGGKTISGSFPDFDAYIEFDPERLWAGRVFAHVNVGKVKSIDKDAEQSLPNRDWFNAPVYPKAEFKTLSFAAAPGGGNQYIAKCNLTLHGVYGPIVLPFTLTFFTNDETHPPLEYAQMEGQFTLNRLDYKLGSGDFATTDILANLVTVKLHLLVQKVP